MVQERPFSGNTWDLSADPDRSRALQRVYASPWLPCWGFSSARTACTPEAPASERAAHPSATPQDSCRLDWGLHCAGTGGGSGRTAATSSSPCPIAAAGRSSCEPAVEVLDQTAGSHNPIGELLHVGGRLRDNALVASLAGPPHDATASGPTSAGIAPARPPGQLSH